MGFPPGRGDARPEWFARLGDEERTVVFFESPHRIRRTLSQLQPYLVNRQILVARELSKTYEELVISPTQSQATKEVGEFTVVVGPHTPARTVESTVRSNEIMDTFWRITNIGGFDEQTAIRLAAAATGLKPASVRKLLKKGKILAERQSRSMP